MKHPQAFEPTSHLIQVKGGADYLEVKWRLVWFRHEYPFGRVFTEVVENDREGGYACVRARVEFDCTDSEGRDRIAVAEGTGTETASDFADYLEKSETKAIGRALAGLGYGTQFVQDFDMQDPDGSPHVVDAPAQVQRIESRSSKGDIVKAALDAVCEECGKRLTPSRSNANSSGMSVADKARLSKRKTGRVLCYDHYQEAIAV